MKKYAIIFVTASILGFIMESLFVYAASGAFRASGNHGMYYQLYGFCSVALYIIYTKFKFTPLKFFIFGVFAVLIVEFSASMFLDYVLNEDAWSYCDEITNIFCRTSVIRGVLISSVTTFYVVFLIPVFLRLGKDKLFLYVCYFGLVFILVDSFIQLVYTLFSFIK